MLRARSISTIGAVMALAIPAGAGAQQDLRSPDARDAGQSVVSTPQDLRSPDAVDARHAALLAGQQDLRSPDAKDSAPAASVQGQLAPIEVTPAVPAATPSASNGFEWGDAGIGAAGMLGIIALITGAGLLAVRYRHGHGGGTITPSH